MFTDSREYELIEISSGATASFTARPLTLSMKDNLDEWLRFNALRYAVKEGESVKEAEELISGLDFFLNNWFYPESTSLPRALWEVSKPGIPFADFRDRYFQIPVGNLNDETSAENERFQHNFETMKEVLEFSVRNPTKRATKEAGVKEEGKGD